MSNQQYLDGMEPKRVEASSLGAARQLALVTYLRGRAETKLDESSYKAIKSATGLSASQADKVIDTLVGQKAAEVFVENTTVILRLFDSSFCPDCGFVMRRDEQGDWICGNCGGVVSASL